MVRWGRPTRHSRCLCSQNDGHGSTNCGPNGALVRVLGGTTADSRSEHGLMPKMDLCQSNGQAVQEPPGELSLPFLRRRLDWVPSPPLSGSSRMDSGRPGITRSTYQR